MSVVWTRCGPPWRPAHRRSKANRTPRQLAAEHLKAKPEFANPASRGRAGTCDATKARFIADAAERISQPDTRVGQIRLLAGDAAFAALHPVIPAEAIGMVLGGKGIGILVCQLEPGSDMWDELRDALALLARSDDGARGGQ